MKTKLDIESQTSFSACLLSCLGKVQVSKEKFHNMSNFTDTFLKHLKTKPTREKRGELIQK